MVFEATPDQARAVAAVDGRLSITAGAGSGKTRVLAERFVAAVDPAAPVSGWRPADVGAVLTVTFTEKAAGEIAERVRRVFLEHGLVGEARRVDEAWISTIHGLCTRLLRTHALEAGLDPWFGVIPTADTGALRDEVMEALLRDEIASGRATALVATYGAAATAEYVGAVHDRLRAMGATPDAVAVEEPENARVLLADAAPIVSGWARCLAGHRSPAATMQANVVAATSAADALASLSDHGPHGDAEIAHGVLRVLHGLKLANRVVDAKELVNGCLRERAALIDRAVRAVTVPLARDLAALVAAFGARYAAAKAVRGVLDFEDLQLGAVALLRDVPGVAARYRSLFRLVMIDEFQDTNEVQTALVDLLADGTLCTVGDERQSIYGFRYADVGVYRSHTERMLAEGAATVALAKNFRSHAGILAFVNRVFGDDALFGDTFLRLEHGRDEAALASPLRPGEPRVEMLLVSRSARAVAAARSVEADAVARRVRQLVDSGVPQGDVVVLLRAMSQVDTYATALDRHSVGYTVVAGGSFFGRPEIEALRAFLRAASNPRDDAAFALLLASGMVGLTDDGLARLRRAAGKGALWQAIDKAGLGVADAAAAARARDAVASARAKAETLPVARIVHEACEALDYDLYLLALGAAGRHAYANVLKLARLAEEFERAGGAGVRAFADHLDLKERYRDKEAPASVIDERADAVRIMTVHAAKGLEFPVVVVPELGRDPVSDRGALLLEKDGAAARIALSLPDEDSSKAEERRSAWASAARERAKARDIEEEKRLLYVACTRARELLLLSGSAKAANPGEDRPLGWVCHALGLEGGSVITGTIGAGEAKVRVTRLEEDEELAAPAPPRERAVALVCPAAPEPAPEQAPEARPGTPPSVSHSSMRLYDTCALRYHLEKIVRIGDAAPPAEHDPLRFGEAVHAALQLVGAGGAAPGDERLDAIARRWRLAPEELARLRAAVQGLLASASCRAAYAGDAPAHEVPFAVRLEGATLVGKIDLLARTPDGALVLDYKTGPDALADGADEGHTAQADCYALAVLSGGAERVRVTFVGVETGVGGAPLEMSFAYTAEDRARLLADASARASALAAGPFEPLPKYEPRACGDCPAAGVICPVGGAATRARRGSTPPASAG